MGRRPSPKDYELYVEHPRFGKAPRFTGLDPDPDAPDVHLHWNTGFWTKSQRTMLEGLFLQYPFFFSDDRRCLIMGTAIRADLERQTPATVPVTHYYDLDLVCRDCARPFLFFAKEQKHWYETLGFPLESGCVRCHPCRKAKRATLGKRRQYEELFQRADRTPEETLAMADCCLALIEEGAFSPRQTEKVRYLLNRIPEDRRSREEYRDIRDRLSRFSGGMGS